MDKRTLSEAPQPSLRPAETAPPNSAFSGSTTLTALADEAGERGNLLLQGPWEPHAGLDYGCVMLEGEGPDTASIMIYAADDEAKDILLAAVAALPDVMRELHSAAVALDEAAVLLRTEAMLTGTASLMNAHAARARAALSKGTVAHYEALAAQAGAA